ncbi:hypothetical protein [Caloramator mitchellensis]|uniref:hypothetical protein n=1 Tax=Caloramator mitchellensis TaxID=908809 RepID=UPI00128E9DB5|nr:hypothetical protein [Caloramator mitchellensis]
MKQTTQTIKDAMKGISRYITCKVIFDFTDVTILDDNKTLSTSDNNSITDSTQIINKNRDRAYKIATFEKDKFKLDGSYRIPSSNANDNGEQGWWSSFVCDSEGNFSAPPTIQIVFDNIHSIPALTITFDTLENEYATDFEVMVYDATDILIENQHIQANDKTQVLILGNFYQFKKIVLKINKWNKPYRFSKVTEIDFGVLKTYDDTQLIKASLIDEVNLLNETLPASEFSFTIDNSNNEFNLLNPDSAYKFLQERQQVTVYMGIEANGQISYYKIGTYYLTEWKTEQSSFTFTFVARSIIDTLLRYDYESVMPRTTNLYNIAVEILNTAGITDYEIDTRLQQISTLGLMEKTNCRDALLMVLQAGRSYCYTDSNGKIHIVQDTTDLNNAVDSIELQNMYSEPEISLSKAIKRVKVSYFIDLETKTDVIVENELIEKGEIYPLEGNTLINTEEHAIDVANWLMKWLKRRAVYSVNWRQNYLLDLLDVVTIENRFNNKNAVIYKQELNYQGYLSGRTEARGDINVMA